MTPDPVTLENCASEPIHIPGAIQPHGVLFACESDTLTVSQVSANVAHYLGSAAEQLLGARLLSLFDAASQAQLESVAVDPTPRPSPVHLVSTRGDTFDAVVHKSDQRLVIELEPAKPELAATVGSFDPRLRATLLKLQSSHDASTLCTIAAEEVRALTGFDRVMVYRFDAEWNGEVVAESKREDLEPFLGMHYPASDIPAQARRLYTVNWLRMIGDVDYEPVPLLPELDPATGAALDLSHSVLRSVSPIHIEYLKNMGVTASMSISLVIDGQLAGLIACHHYSGPYLLKLRVRDTVEYVGQALSWQLNMIETAELAQNRRRALEHEARVMRAVAITSELLDGLATPSLVALTEATGAAVVLAEGTRTIGETPPLEVVDGIVAWLRNQGHDAFATEQLSASCPAAAGWEHLAAGLIAVTISREVSEYLLWFRPAVERTIRWAGDPRKSLSYAPGVAPRLSPRGSFELWLETVRGRAQPWGSWQIEMASSLRRVILGGVRRRAVELRSLNERLLNADRAKDEFIVTVSHELRTPLNAISGWTSLLQSGGVPAERLQHGLAVIARNAKLQTRLVDDLLDIARITTGKLSLEVEPIDLAKLADNVTDALLPTAEAKGVRVEREIDFAAGIVHGDSARLRQVVSNLLGNAIKFTPHGGWVRVALKRDAADLELAVADSGQGIDPAFLEHVFERFRQEDQQMNRRSQGLGLGLAIVKRLAELHGGSVSAESAGLGRGACFRLRVPLVPLPKDAPLSERDTPVDATISLAGLQLLIVEDERDAQEFERQLLERAGAAVSVASDAATALALLSVHSFDLVVSDIGMPDIDGFEFMRQLRKRPPEQGGRTPAVALTAYTRASDRTMALKVGFQAHVPKPVDAGELIAVIASVCGRFGD